ncbi:MAG: tRNA (adenosine(37)-N6)-threonylcarbamoyltransferase complex ATPase subunit type 1 TsaE [Clostridia bacterium]|nr:tRNA (adenosine(37)-N6)-threonylcarbamoyltransferase complex ATPase subunit type 1 TsaE [Clostridia bacterium]
MSTTKKQKFFSVEKIAVTGILTAISWVLYMYVKFPLPFIFPSFLDIQFSDMPALLGGFAWGPWVGCAIVVLRGLLKMPFSGTACVGEIADIIIGIALVLPASLIYQKHKSKKGAIVSLLVGSACAVLASVAVNRFMLIPLYVKLLFNGSWEPLLGMVSGIYPDVTKETFYSYYILLATIPFNALRCFICALITYFVYKPLSKALHWEFKPKKSAKDAAQPKQVVNVYQSGSVDETIALGETLGKTLQGGQTVLLSGDLGAGKTHFTKGIALGMGVTEVVTSPTFAIHNVYQGASLVLNHFDFYKVESAEEIANLGFDEIIGATDGVCVMEWWQNVNQIVPANCVEVVIEVVGEQSRKVTITHWE